MGGITTLVLLYITLVFACVKLVQLMQRMNPTVNTASDKYAYSNDEKLRLKDINFMMAFTLESYFTEETKDDPRFLKWVALLVKGTNG